MTTAFTAMDPASTGSPTTDHSTAFDLPSDLPMVWVTQGKTDHAAYILKIENDGRRMVKWVASGITQWITADAIIKTELPKRRRRRPTTGDSNFIFQHLPGAQKEKEKPTAAATNSAAYAEAIATGNAAGPFKKRPRKKEEEGKEGEAAAPAAFVQPVESSPEVQQRDLVRNTGKYPIGTKVYKEFPPFGWFSGRVVGHTQRWWYQVQYEDDDSEEMTEKELDKIVVRESFDEEDEKEEESSYAAQQTAGEETASSNYHQKRPTTLRPTVIDLPTRKETTSEDTSDEEQPIAVMAKKKRSLQESRDNTPAKKTRLEGQGMEEGANANPGIVGSVGTTTVSSSLFKKVLNPSETTGQEAASSPDSADQLLQAKMETLGRGHHHEEEKKHSYAKKDVPSLKAKFYGEVQQSKPKILTEPKEEKPAADTGISSSTKTIALKPHSPAASIPEELTKQIFEFKGNQQAPVKKPPTGETKDAASLAGKVAHGKSLESETPPTAANNQDKSKEDAKEKGTSSDKASIIGAVQSTPKIQDSVGPTMNLKSSEAPKNELTDKPVVVGSVTASTKLTFKDGKWVPKDKVPDECSKSVIVAIAGSSKEGLTAASKTPPYPVAASSKQYDAPSKPSETEPPIKPQDAAPAKPSETEPSIKPSVATAGQSKPTTTEKPAAAIAAADTKPPAIEVAPKPAVAESTGRDSNQPKPPLPAKALKPKPDGSPSAGIGADKPTTDGEKPTAKPTAAAESPSKPPATKPTTKSATSEQTSKSVAVVSDDTAKSKPPASNAPKEQAKAATATSSGSTNIAKEQANSATEKPSGSTNAPKEQANSTTAKASATNAPKEQAKPAQIAASVQKASPSKLPPKKRPLPPAPAVQASRKSRRIACRKDKKDKEEEEEEPKKPTPAKRKHKEAEEEREEPSPAKKPQTKTQSKSKAKVDKKSQKENVEKPHGKEKKEAHEEHEKETQKEKNQNGKKLEEESGSEEESISSEECTTSASTDSESGSMQEGALDDMAVRDDDVAMKDDTYFMRSPSPAEEIEIASCDDDDEPEAPQEAAGMDRMDLAAALLSMGSILPPDSKPAAQDLGDTCKKAASDENVPMAMFPAGYHPPETCCTVCGQHIPALDEAPVDWSRPLHYATDKSAIDAIVEHTTKFHSDTPVWNVLEATKKLEFESGTADVPVTPVSYVKLALRHAVCSSYSIDEDLLDMTKLRDMFIRRLGIARGFIRWSSDSFLEGRKFVNCSGQPVTNPELRQSSLLLLAYLEQHVLEHAFKKNYHLTKTLAHSMPFLQWRNAVQCVFLDPNGVENSWFMKEDHRPY